MAVDSAGKRLSIMQIAGEGFSPAMVIPDGTISEPDRQALLWGYSGIEWGEPTIASGLAVVRMYAIAPAIEFDGLRSKTNFGAASPYIEFSATV